MILFDKGPVLLVLRDEVAKCSVEARQHVLHALSQALNPESDGTESGEYYGKFQRPSTWLSCF